MREQGIHRIEMHVAALCIAHGSNPIQILALHRTPQRALFPGYWEGIGGQVQAGESLEQAVGRQLLEEAGITGRIICPYATYVIEPGSKTGATVKIPGIRFLVLVNGKPDIVVNHQEHQGGGWVALDNLRSLKFIPGLLKQIHMGVNLYEALSSERITPSFRSTQRP